MRKNRHIFKFFLSLCMLMILSLPSVADLKENPIDQSTAARGLPSPLLIVGTLDAEGRRNFGTFDRGGVATSEPELHFAISMRPKTQTWKNLIATKSATINIPNVSQLPEVDLLGTYSGMQDGKYVDKLALTGLTSVMGKKIKAPMIEEFPLSYECELVSSEKLTPDATHELVILKVVNVWIDEKYVNEKGYLNPKPEGLSEIAFYLSGREPKYGYYGIGDSLGNTYEPGSIFKERFDKEFKKDKKSE